MRGEIRRVTDAGAFRRPSAATVSFLTARPAFTVLGPAPMSGGTALDVGGPPPTARR
jgi:hypothetical protein